ncbi:MAG: hypothetical protein DRJ52_03025 [Thermoprotei archaeon]|nr:MAG: hypothetical protein DRJ52_03025 [Thermoprotei archaeon]RLF01028.1 MAG: hypothetical protein DRJ63_00390 [Thermoprotei archaeon]
MSKLISGITGRNYQDVYRELSMLREGECYYITKNYATKVKVKYYPLKCVERRSVVDEERLIAVAREHRVSVERLRRVLTLVSKEDFLEALKRKDYRWLARYNLAHVSRGKLSRLGEATAAYYSIDVSQVS